MVKIQADDIYRDRLGKIRDCFPRVGLKTDADLYNKVLDKAHERLEELPMGSDEYEKFKKISSWEDTQPIRKALVRGHTLYNELIELICRVFADFDTGKENPEAKIKSYRRKIFGDTDPGTINSAPQDHEPPQESPFDLQIMPSSGELVSDLFFNASYAGLAAMAEGLDIRRKEYSREPDGIRSHMLRNLGAEPGLRRLFLQGKAGAGKTVLLDRLTADLIELGFPVYKCDPFAIRQNAFFDSLAALLQSAAKPLTLIFDDAYRLQQRGIEIGSLSADALGKYCRTPVTLVLADNWAIRPGFTPLDQRLLGAKDKLFHLTELTGSEIEDLLDRIISEERSGRLTEIRCLLPREERRRLLTSQSDRLVVHALLKLRYGKNIIDLLRDEYESIEEPLIRDLYRKVGILDSLDTPTPSFLMNDYFTRLARKTDKISPSRVEQTFFSKEGSGYRIRHPILVRPLLKVMYPEIADRPYALYNILADLDLFSRQQREFCIRFLTGPRKARRISDLFGPNRNIAAKFLELMEQGLEQRMLDAEIGAIFFNFQATISKDVLCDFNRAAEEFDRAYKLDESNPYTLRHRAWTALRRGNLTQAESYACEAVEKLSGDPHTMGHCAFVLSWCSKSSFERAREIYMSLERTGELDSEFHKHWERFQEAYAYFKLLKEYPQTEDIPASVLQVLEAPSFVWKVKKYGSKLYPRALLEELRVSLTRGEEGDFYSITADCVKNNEFTEEDLNKRRELLGVLKGNIARQFYQKWYQNEIDINLDVIDNLFKEAIKLNPQDPFIPCWFGTFFKEARGDFANAEKWYKKALEISRRPRRNPDDNLPRPKKAQNDWLYEHPMILNNLALLIMENVYRQAQPPRALLEAYRLLVKAIEKSNAPESRFKYPLENFELLKKQAEEFGITLPNMKPLDRPPATH